MTAAITARVDSEKKRQAEACRFFICANNYTRREGGYVILEQGTGIEPDFYNTKALINQGFFVP